MAVTCCNGLVGRWCCLPTGGEIDVETAVRNARIKTAVTTFFLGLAIATFALGVTGFFGNKLVSAASLLSKNAMWLTVAGSLSLALFLITMIGYCCYQSSAEDDYTQVPPHDKAKEASLP